jgi:4-amino-4-deoxy-L-arabinose transferase-like glycosyltransferase
MKIFTSLKRYILSKPERFLIFLLAVWWVANLFQSAFMELHYDEAYYWMFSKHLAPGYFDHPPMTALLIRLGSFFSESELGVRLFITLLQPVYLYLFWTLLRTPSTTNKDALLYVLLCASIPMLQVYGFVATPDAPLMFFTGLLLVAYSKFLKSDSWWWTLLLGVSMGLLAYSKYHGALVVICILFSNLRLLRNPRVYVAALVAFLLLLPHLLWQYDNDWASFRYHLLDRNKVFRFSYITEYLLNAWACYNPLVVPLFVYALFKRKPQPGVERALYYVVVGFFFFFLFSTLRGYVQPQWTLVAAYGMVFVTYLFAMQHERVRIYLMRVGCVTIAILLVVRLAIMLGFFNATKLEFVNNAARNAKIAAAAEGAPVMFRPSYKAPPLYTFYARQPSDSQKSFCGRKSQFNLWNLDEEFAGKRVMVEVSYSDSSVVDLGWGDKFYYTFVDSYIPIGELQRMAAQPAFEAARLDPTLLMLLNQSLEKPVQ